jgi:hypothetical protein
MRFEEFSRSIRVQCKNKAEYARSRVFLEYCEVTFGEEFSTERLGLWEFAEFIQFLQAIKEETVVYLTSTGTRNLCRKTEKNRIKFKTSPVGWKCPPKPDIDHFDPLSREEYQKLCAYLDAVFNRIRERLDLIEKAKKHTSSVETSGWAFANKKKSFFMHQVTLIDALSSLLKYFPDFPVDAELEALNPDGKYGLNNKKVIYEDLANEVKVLRKRVAVQRVGKSTLPALSDFPGFSFQDVLDHLLPSEEEACAVRDAICLETGWSPDLAARINPHDFIFDTIDPDADVCFLKTIKVKGTQRGNPYQEGKSMVYPSNKHKADSAYNLVKLWLERTKPLRQTKRYAALVDELGFEPLFVFVRDLQTILKNGPLKVIHPVFEGVNTSPVQKLRRRTLGFSFDPRQLKPTQAYFKSKDQNVSFALQVTLFGHSTSAVTDEFYQSGSHFQQDRKDRLSQALADINESIRDGSFAGELIPLREKKTLTDKIYTVFSDHSNRNPIAICSDPYAPSWAGHKGRVKPGQACKAFNKCLLCSRSRVFSDNLPFVVDRYLYLEKKKRALREDQFSIYQDEYNAAKNVVDSWPYLEDVEDAKERTFLEGHILPPIISGDSL